MQYALHLFPLDVSKTLANFGKQHVSPRPAPWIRNRPAPSFCPPIVIPKLMMSFPGNPTRAGIFDNPGCISPSRNLGSCLTGDNPLSVVMTVNLKWWAQNHLFICWHRMKQIAPIWQFKLKLLKYCKSTIFGRYQIWRLGESGPIWRTLIWLLEGHPKWYSHILLQQTTHLPPSWLPSYSPHLQSY